MAKQKKVKATPAADAPAAQKAAIKNTLSAIEAMKKTGSFYDEGLTTAFEDSLNSYLNNNLR